MNFVGLWHTVIFIGLWHVTENVVCVVFFEKVVLRFTSLKLDYVDAVYYLLYPDL